MFLFFYLLKEEWGLFFFLSFLGGGWVFKIFILLLVFIVIVLFFGIDFLLGFEDSLGGCDDFVVFILGCVVDIREMVFIGLFVCLLIWKEIGFCWESFCCLMVFSDIGFEEVCFFFIFCSFFLRWLKRGLDNMCFRFCCCYFWVLLFSFFVIFVRLYCLIVVCFGIFWWIVSWFVFRIWW